MSEVPPGKWLEDWLLMLVTSISLFNELQWLLASVKANFFAPVSPPRAGAACIDIVYVSGPILSTPLDCAQDVRKRVAIIILKIFVLLSLLSIFKANLAHGL